MWGSKVPNPVFNGSTFNSRNGSASSHIPQNEMSASTCRVFPPAPEHSTKLPSGQIEHDKEKSCSKGTFDNPPSVHPGWRSFNLFLKVHEQPTQQRLGPRAGVDTAGIKNPYYFHGHKSQEVGHILDRKACPRMCPFFFPK